MYGCTGKKHISYIRKNKYFPRIEKYFFSCISYVFSPVHPVHPYTFKAAEFPNTENVEFTGKTFLFWIISAKMMYGMMQRGMSYSPLHLQNFHVRERDFFGWIVQTQPNVPPNNAAASLQLCKFVRLTRNNKPLFSEVGQHRPIRKAGFRQCALEYGRDDIGHIRIQLSVYFAGCCCGITVEVVNTGCHPITEPVVGPAWPKFCVSLEYSSLPSSTIFFSAVHSMSITRLTAPAPAEPLTMGLSPVVMKQHRHVGAASMPPSRLPLARPTPCANW